MQETLNHKKVLYLILASNFKDMDIQKNNKAKKLATTISIFSNCMLIAMKIIAGVISGSIGIISEAIHSFSDLLASFIAYISVIKSAQPADEDHSYGHGKYEDLSGFIEGWLIIFAALYIAYEAVKKIVFNANAEISVDLGIYVMAISAIINCFISWYLFHVAKKTGSIAVYADAEHLRTDILSSAGVCFGLILIKITNIHILDPIIALVVATIILVAGLRICNQAKNNLVDKSLSEEEVEKIEEIIDSFIDGSDLIAIKHLRTRKSGIKKNIELVIIANKNLTIENSHKLCDKIEHRLSETIGNTEVSIHLEPNYEQVIA